MRVENQVVSNFNEQNPKPRELQSVEYQVYSVVYREYGVNAICSSQWSDERLLPPMPSISQPIDYRLRTRQMVMVFPLLRVVAILVS